MLLKIGDAGMLTSGQAAADDHLGRYGVTDLNILVAYANAVVLKLDGELDICSAPHLRSIVDDVLAERPTRLVLDRPSSSSWTPRAWPSPLEP